jgi:isocitrate dehydrogenase
MNKMEQTKLSLSDSSSIIAEQKEYKGQKAIDLRKYVTSTKYSGPTKSGLWIPVEKWEEFKEMVNSVEVPTETEV